MVYAEKQKTRGLIPLLITLSVVALAGFLGLMCGINTLDVSEKPYLIQVDFNGDSSWDASFLADSYDSDGNQLIMRFGDERYGIEYSSFLATRLYINREDHEPGPLGDTQAEKLLELSKDEEESGW